MARLRFLLVLCLIPVILLAFQSHPVFKGKTSEQLLKLDPLFQKQMIDRYEGKTTFSVYGVASLNQNTTRAIIYTDNPQELSAYGIQVNSVLPDFVTVHATYDQLLEITSSQHVRFIKKGHINYPMNDVARGEIGADALQDAFLNNTHYKGNGVILCIIDTGIDFEHYDFRDPDDPTKSRILYIWDQTLTKTGSETSPTILGLDYGVEYNQSQIEDEINGVTSGFVREQDTNGHGTHVTGSAAGNGASLVGMNYAGMAPEADIIFIKAGNYGFPASNVIDALTYAREKATSLGKAIVVNMSLGGNDGPHDGTDAQSLAMDLFSDAGRILVCSAGNEGNDNIHYSGTIGANSSLDISITVPSYTAASNSDNDDFWWDVWFDGAPDVDANVMGPGEADVFCGAGAWEDFNTTDGSIYVYNYTDAGNGDRQILGKVSDGNASSTPSTGSWTLRLTNNEDTPQDFHFWMFDFIIGIEEATVTIDGSDTDYTLGNFANEAIIVASYTHRWYWSNYLDGKYWGGMVQYLGDISSFSSHGPTRDGREKPDITAPGDKIVSAHSQWASPSDIYIMPGSKHEAMQGTSMSSPVTAGAVALLLQQDPTLDYDDVRQLLTDNAITDEYTGTTFWDASWGYGKLDIFSAMGDLLAISPQPKYEVLIYDQQASYSNYIAIGQGANQYPKVAVQFTPTITGQVAGCFFHTDGNCTMSQPLSIEIWSNNGGAPVSKLSGSNTVSMPVNKIQDFNMHYVNLQDARAVVQAGEHYHIVIAPQGANDCLNLFVEYNNVPDLRSRVYTGTAWSTAIPLYDFVIRPVVANGAGGVVPVTLSGLAVEAISEKVAVLKWTTQTEIRNMGFNVLRSVSPNGPWTRINNKLIPGAGTSQDVNDYEFSDKSLSGQNTVYYKIEQVDTDGITTHFGPVALNKSTLPKQFALHQNYPNPFNSNTTLQYDLPEESVVKISIYNVRGELVRTLFDNKQPAGSHRLVWDGTGQNGLLTASGIYWVKLEAGEFEKTIKLLFAK